MISQELDELLTAVSGLDRKSVYLSGLLDTRKTAVAGLEAKLMEAKANQALLDKVKAVLSHLLESTSHKDLKGMDSLVTYGLNTVYPEKNLSFQTEIIDTGKKISVEMSTLRSGAKASKDQHGSVSVLESLIIRILSILKMNGARFLIADEPFAAIGADHINNVGTLLEELSKKLNMDILLVTHNPGVSDACMFRATLGSGDQLKLSKVGGSDKSGAVEDVPVGHDAVNTPEEELLAPATKRAKKTTPARKKAVTT